MDNNETTGKKWSVIAQQDREDEEKEEILNELSKISIAKSAEWFLEEAKKEAQYWKGRYYHQSKLIDNNLSNLERLRNNLHTAQVTLMELERSQEVLDQQSRKRAIGLRICNCTRFRNRTIGITRL